jgi:transcriptional regulator with XRE-family HTH domain
MGDAKESRSDRRAGAMLDPDAVERMRRAVVWLQKNRGLRLKDVANECDIAEHTVRNFAYGKSGRPDNTSLGRLYRFLETYREFVPGDILPAPRANRSPREGPANRSISYEFLRNEFPLEEADVHRVYERYAGYYLCYRQSYRSDRLSVSWLHIRSLKRGRTEADELPLPRFTLYAKFPDRFDAAEVSSYIIYGYVLTRHERLFFTGQRDGDLKYMVLREPSVRKFTYLHGLCLFTSVDDREPFAARMSCQYLGPTAGRDPRRTTIGLYAPDEFRNSFANAEVIERALGPQGLLLSGG